MKAVAALALALVLATPAGAQGCSQCRESVGQTPSVVQRSYRRGIVLMVLAAGGVFTASAATLRRLR